MTEINSLPTQKDNESDVTKKSMKVIKECQEHNIIYPVRLALTETRINKIYHTYKPLELPTELPKEGDDYELRRLRDGYIYIIAVETQHCDIASYTQDGYQLYAYRYYSHESKSQDNLYVFQQEHYLTDLQTPPTPVNISKSEKFIRLPKSVNHFDILYSDIRLPAELLKQLLTSQVARTQWMRHIILDAQIGGVASIFNASHLVKDFSISIDAESSNQKRFFPVGCVPALSSIQKTLELNKGYIVAVEDEIGTSRDLMGYHIYLEQERLNIQEQYKYAIKTATLIHYHVLNEYFENRNKMREIDRQFGLGNGSLVKSVENPEQIYHNFDIAKEHLSENAHQDIFNELANKLNIEPSEIKGINAINKMAIIPQLYGKQFKYLALTHISHITDIYTKRLKMLDNILIKCAGCSLINEAEFWCLYTHGLWNGLNLSKFGSDIQGRFIAAIEQDNEIQQEESWVGKYTGLATKIKDYGLAMRNVLISLKTIADNEQFKIASYDLVVEIFITKHAVRKRLSKHISNLPNWVLWREVYEVYPLTKNKIQKKEASWTIPEKDIDYKKFKLEAHFLPENYQMFSGVSGLAKLLNLSAVLTVFNSHSKTKLGEFANNPIVNIILAVGQNRSPSFGVEKAIDDRKKKLLENSSARKYQKSLDLKITAADVVTDKVFTKASLKAAFVNINTGLTFLSCLIEFGIWTEMKYRHDDIGMTAAILRGAGAFTMDISYGVLGILASRGIILGAEISLKMLFTTAVGLWTLAFWLGGIALVIGIIYGFFSKSDIELWIENGFWGNSENYWGKPVDLFNWSDERTTSNKDFNGQFNKSVFNNENENQTIQYNYQIELQRYFQFSSKIKLSRYSPISVLVEHPSITNNQIAKSIEVDKFYIIGKFTNWVVKNDQPTKIEFLTDGQAVLYFDNKLQLRFSNNDGTLDHIPLNDIWLKDTKNIEMKVSMDTYQGADSKFDSDLINVIVKQN